MANRRFEMYDLRTILVRMRLGASDRDLKRAGLVGRRKAAAIRRQAMEFGWLNPSLAMPSEEAIAKHLIFHDFRPGPQTSITPFAELVAQWSADGIQGTTIHAKLRRDFSYQGSYESVKRFIRKLPRPVAVTMILDFKSGEAAQVDFGSGPRLLDPSTGLERRSWAFIMTLCFSRHQYVEFVFDQKIETWLRCHRHAFESFNGVVERVIIDNLKSGITKACFHDPEVQRSFADFAEGYGFMICACPPRDPQKKGIVESGVKFMKRGFLPLRMFKDIQDANRQAQEWVMTEAGNRIHGTTKRRPLDLFTGSEQAFLKPLPPIAPEMVSWIKAKLHPDCHVTFEKCRYSAPFGLIGRELWLRTTISMVEIYHEHSLVASHVRLRTPGRRSTIVDHLPPEARAWLMKTPQWCIEQAGRVGPYCLQFINEMLSDRVLERLRAAQGTLELSKKYGTDRLESACHRAVDHGLRTRKDVLRILENNLDIGYPEPDAMVRLPDLYVAGSAYCRDYRTFFT
jgi:transposase